MDRSIVDRITDEMRLRNFSKGSIQQYTSAAQRLIRAFPDQNVNDLTEEHIKAYLLACLGDGRKPTSIRVLVAAFRFLFVHVLRKPDVVAHVAFPRRAKRLPSAPTRQDIAHILDAAKTIGLRAWLVCALAYGCGLRVSEITGLHTWDICSKEGFLLVREGKGGKERKTLLPDEVLAGLRRWWKDQRLDNPSFLFPAKEEGKYLSPETLRSDFHRAVRKAGIRTPIRLHDLRHGFVTHLVEAKVDLFTIQALAGHEDLATTQVYVRVDASRFRHIDSLLGALPKVQA